MNTTPSLLSANGVAVANPRCRFDLTKDLAEQIIQLRQLSPGEAIERIEEALPFLRRLNDPKSIYPAYIVLVQSYLILGAHDRAASIVEEAQKLERRLHEPSDKGYLLNFLCSYYATSTQCDLGKAYDYNLRTQRCARLAGSDYLHALVYTQRGIIHCAALELDKALECHLLSREYAERQRVLWQYESGSRSWKTLRTICIAYRNIGSIYNQLDDLTTAHRYFRLSLKFACKTEGLYDIVQGHLTMGFILRSMRRYRHSLFHDNEALQLAREGGLASEVISTLSGMAVTYGLQGNVGQALQCSDEAITLSRRHGDMKAHAKALIGRGDALLGAERFREAEESYLEAESIKLRLPFRQELEGIYRGLLEICTKTGETAKYIAYQTKYSEILSTKASLERQRNIARIEQREKLREVERRHADLLRKLEETEKKASKLSKEVDLVRTRLIRHQESLCKLRQFLRQHLSEADTSIGKAVLQLIQSVDSDKAESENLNAFEFEFEQTTREFSQTLLLRCSELTPTELRICIYTRLGLPIKKIAELMYIALDTVKTHRKHIRRKLGMKTSENLTSYLIGIR